MARIQAPDPLLSASPALRPTAKPLQIQIGATPAPSRSPLMELANSFQNVNAELRDLLRDTAAREEKDAQALGEIEAGRLMSEKRIQELDKVLKDKVDKGELPAVRLPAAQRAASLRIGHEHAEVGLQTYLLSKKEEAVRGKPEDIDALIQKGYEEFGKAIGPDAFFERQGFERAAQEVVGQFRKRVAQEQAIEAEKFQRETRANEGSELLFQLATADADTAPVARDLVKAHLDTIRGEMPKSEVTPFFTASVLKPTVARLIEAKDFDAAAQLLDSMKSLDLTGKGGLYGKTAEGGSAIMELSALVDQKAKHARGADADRLRDELFVSEAQGRIAAAEIIAKTRQENGGLLPLSERQHLITENVGGLSPLAAQTFTQVLNTEYENQERHSLNPQVGAKLISRADSLDPQALDLVEAEANTLLSSGEISAAVWHDVDKLVKRNRALMGAVDDRDVEGFQKAIFAAPGLTRGSTTINVGDDSLIDVWDGLTEDQRTSLRVAASDAFVQNLRQQIRTLSQGLPENVPGIKAQAFDKASTAARETAKSLLVQTKRTRAAEAEQAQTAKQAAALKAAKAQSRLFESPYGKELEMTRNAQDFRAVPKVDLKDEKVAEALVKDRALPRAERDFATVAFRAGGLYFPFRGLRDYRLVSLPDLAKASETDTESRLVYAAAKSRLGFTPEEIKAGKTKHGVEFSPDQIDPKRIPVFRSVAELNKHWNNGEFDETFATIGDMVDAQDTLTPQEFYLAQIALLSK